MTKFYDQVKDSHLIRNLIIYSGTIWGLIQVFDFLATKFSWDESWVKIITILGFGSIPSAIVFLYFYQQKGNVWLKATLYLVNILLIGLILFLIAPFSTTYQSTNPAINATSIVVLPFTNSSNGSSNDYFSDGITEDLSTQLSKIKSLSVISQTTALHYKGTKKTLKEIGQELKANLIVEGNVQSFDNRIRIRARLINAVTDQQLWSETYDRTLKEIFDVQSDVAQKIASSLNTQLSLEEKKRIASKPTENVEAYNLYLKGRYYWNQRTEENLKKGIEQFEKAIALDSNYSKAYSGIADCYTALGYGAFLSPHEAFKKAYKAAKKALTIDSLLAEPHASLGYYEFYYQWNFKAAEDEFRKAIQLNPDYEIAYDWYGYYLTAMERFDEAKTILKKAEDMDPLSVPLSTDMGFSLYYSGNYDEAAAQLKASLELRPNFSLAHLWLGRVYQEQKKYEDAIKEYEFTLKAIPDWPVALAAIGYVYGISGQTNKANETLARMLEISKDRFVTAYGVALVYAAMNNKDLAFKWLDKAYEERSNWLVWMNIDPRWKNIKTDKRFAALASKVGLASK